MAFWNRNKPAVESLGALAHQADMKQLSAEGKAAAKAEAAEDTAGDVRVRSNQKEGFVSIFPKEGDIKRDKSFFNSAKEKAMGFLFNRRNQKETRAMEAKVTYRAQNFLAENKMTADELEGQFNSKMDKTREETGKVVEMPFNRAAELASKVESLNRELAAAGFKEVGLERQLDKAA